MMEKGISIKKAVLFFLVLGLTGCVQEPLTNYNQPQFLVNDWGKDEISVFCNRVMDSLVTALEERDPQKMAKEFSPYARKHIAYFDEILSYLTKNYQGQIVSYEPREEAWERKDWGEEGFVCRGGTYYLITKEEVYEVSFVLLAADPRHREKPGLYSLVISNDISRPQQEEIPELLVDYGKLEQWDYSMKQHGEKKGPKIH